ncbi:hypothetical protein EOPP23_17025 [Endozoicomonas sp. OPT23]|nr:hypothetical protein [Endozoicomonas sp. OPT23]
MPAKDFEVDQNFQKELAATVPKTPLISSETSQKIEAARFLARALTINSVPGHKLLPSISDTHRQQTVSQRSIDRDHLEIQSSLEPETSALKETVRRVSAWGKKPYGPKRAVSTGEDGEKLLKNIKQVKKNELKSLRKALSTINEWSDTQYTSQTLDTMASDMALTLTLDSYPTSEKLYSIKEQLNNLADLLSHLESTEQKALARQHQSLTQLYEGLVASQAEHRVNQLERYLPEGSDFTQTCTRLNIDPKRAFSTSALSAFRETLNHHRLDSELATEAQLDTAFRSELEKFLLKAKTETGQPFEIPQPSSPTHKPVRDQLEALTKASPFYPRGKIFDQICEKLGIEQISDHISPATMQSFRDSLKQSVHESADKGGQWLEGALESITLNFFEPIKNQGSTSLSSEALKKVIRSTIESVRLTPTTITTGYKPPAFGEDSAGLKRTGQQLQCHLQTGQVTSDDKSTFRCQKEELHQRVVSMLINKWVQQRDDIDLEIKGRLADCGKLDFQNNPKNAHAEYSSLQLEIAHLKEQRQKLPLPDFPLMSLTKPDKSDMDKEFFYSAGISSANVNLKLLDINVDSPIEPFNAITTTVAFSKDSLTHWFTHVRYLHSVMDKCCKYYAGDITEHGPPSVSERKQLDQSFLQTNAAINELLQTPDQPGATAALHILRLQASLLRDYADKLGGYYRPPGVPD